MLKNFFRNEPTQVDEQIDAILLEMDSVEKTSDEYKTLLDRLVALDKIKTESRRSPVSSDTIALIAGNVLVSFVIVAYENRHLTNSRAWQNLSRGRM